MTLRLTTPPHAPDATHLALAATVSLARAHRRAGRRVTPSLPTATSADRMRRAWRRAPHRV